MARYQHTRSLVPHFANHFNETGDEIGTLNVLVGLVENYQFVEFTSLVGCIGHQLKDHNEQAKRFILFKKLITEINDYQPPRLNL